jgi:hypothetical protein
LTDGADKSDDPDTQTIPIRAATDIGKVRQSGPPQWWQSCEPGDTEDCMEGAMQFLPGSLTLLILAVILIRHWRYLLALVVLAVAWVMLTGLVDLVRQLSRR